MTGNGCSPRSQTRTVLRSLDDSAASVERTAIIFIDVEATSSVAIGTNRMRLVVTAQNLSIVINSECGLVVYG